MASQRRRQDSPWLTIVIPAYGEAERLPPTLRAIFLFLRQRGWIHRTEVLVVDDGSTDDTVAVATKLVHRHPCLAIISAPHEGKGAAVRRGMAAARGDYIFLCDADLSMPIGELPRFLPPLCPDADLIIGSREAPGARRFDEQPYRHVMGRVFNRIVRWLAVPGIDDTQCGFKRLTRDAARMLSATMTLDGLCFDVEMLALARLHGLSIVELPIDWRHDRHSRVRPLRDTITMVRDVWRVRSIVARASRTAERADIDPTPAFAPPTAAAD